MLIDPTVIRSIGYLVKVVAQEKTNRVQAGFLYFSQNRGFHLWELDLTKKELRLQYLIHEDLRGDCIIKQKFFLLAKSLYWKSYEPLIFRNPCSKWQSSSIVHF